MSRSEHSSPTSPNTHSPVPHGKERERDADGECGGHGEVEGNEIIIFFKSQNSFPSIPSPRPPSNP